MDSFNFVIIFIVLACFALVSVSVINSQQTRKRLIAQRIVQLRRKVSEYEELASTIETYTGSTTIERVVLDEIVDSLHGMLQLEPDNLTIDLSIANTKARIQEIQAPGYTCQIHRTLESDAAIARAQYMISEAGRIIRKRQAANQLELSEMTSYIGDLAWAHLCVAMISLIAQGHRAVRRGDVLKGYSFYKRAQQAAMESTISDDRRHQIIKELTDIQSNRKKSISPALMPETHLNPDNVDIDIEPPSPAEE